MAISVEPYYKKVSHEKKLLRKLKKILTTNDLRQKIAKHIEKTESEVSPYIPYHMIEDNDNEDTRLIVIFATDKILSYLKTGREVHNIILNNEYFSFRCLITVQTVKILYNSCAGHMCIEIYVQD
jgi:hypothetical protein